MKKETPKEPDYSVKIIWLSLAKILALKYSSYHETFRIENFRFDYDLTDFIYGDMVETVQKIEGKLYTIKIGKNNYNETYLIEGKDIFYETCNKSHFPFGLYRPSLDISNGILHLGKQADKELNSANVEIEYVTYQPLYLAFFRIKLLRKTDNSDQLEILYKKIETDLGSDILKVNAFLMPLHNYKFEKSHFEMQALNLYDEKEILEEIYFLTHEYLTLYEEKDCHC